MSVREAGRPTWKRAGREARAETGGPTGVVIVVIIVIILVIVVITIIVIVVSATAIDIVVAAVFWAIYISVSRTYRI